MSQFKSTEHNLILLTHSLLLGYQQIIIIHASIPSLVYATVFVTRAFSSLHHYTFFVNIIKVHNLCLQGLLHHSICIVHSVFQDKSSNIFNLNKNYAAVSDYKHFTCAKHLCKSHFKFGLMIIFMLACVLASTQSTQNYVFSYKLKIAILD